MAHVIKKGSIKVPTQPKDYDLQATGLVFKSYDNQIALEFNVEQQNGTPADLLGANLRLLMFIYDEVDGMITKEPIPFITKNLITESFLNGQVVYILPEAMKAYNGMVEAYVYIEYPDGSTSDNLGFTFRMKRSTIDGLAQDKADYFIADFQQLLDGVKQEATDAVNEVLAKVEAVSKNVSSAQNDLTILEDRIDQTNQQIGDLGKLKKMYSNSIDFGDYDYSGNPNLIPPISFASLGRVNNKTDTNIPGVTDGGSYFEVNTEVSLASNVSSVFVPFQPRLQPNKTYTLTVSLEYDQAFIDSGASHSIAYAARIQSVLERPVTIIGAKTTTAKQTISKTFTTSGTYGNGQTESFYQLWFATTSKGKIKVYYDFKLEEGSKATPYQPNLLDAPYYLSKIPLGENILKPASFPINTTAYMAAIFTPNEPYVQGQKYTFTMKASKPYTQTFEIYLRAGSLPAGDMVPVEGLADVWQLTFEITQSHIDGGANALNVFQAPQSTKGIVNIEWAKLEKGDTRTPNISEYKYFGEGLKDSNNPNDYSWDVTPEYTEKGLNNAVNVYDPQRVEGLKNFADGIQIAGDKVISENDCTVYTLTKDNSQSFIDGYATFIKHGKEVIVNGTVKFKKAYAFGVPLDDKVPDEFIARIVHGMLIGQSGTNSVSKAMYVQKDLGTIMTNSEFAANEWFTFHGNYWVGGK